MKIKVNKHKLSIHYRGSLHCLRYAHSHHIESHLGKKQPQAKIAIAFLFGQLHFNNVTSHAHFYGGHLVMRSKRCKVQNQGITLTLKCRFTWKVVAPLHPQGSNSAVFCSSCISVKRFEVVSLARVICMDHCCFITATRIKLRGFCSGYVSVKWFEVVVLAFHPPHPQSLSTGSSCFSLTGAWKGEPWLGCGDLPAATGEDLGAGWPQWRPTFHRHPHFF